MLDIFVWGNISVCYTKRKKRREDEYGIMCLERYT